MPTDLEQQLPRFAEALDREAPAISVDEILSRGTVAVDVDRLERPAWDQVPRVAAVSWGDAMPGHGENGERDASIELVPTAARTAGPSPCRAEDRARGRGGRRVGRRPRGDRADRRRTRPCRRAAVDGPHSVATIRSATARSVRRSPLRRPSRRSRATSGGMWPQSTLEEVRAAQELADAGDPAYTWQVDPQLVEDDPWTAERRRSRTRRPVPP